MFGPASSVRLSNCRRPCQHNFPATKHPPLATWPHSVAGPPESPCYITVPARADNWCEVGKTVWGYFENKCLPVTSFYFSCCTWWSLTNIHSRGYVWWRHTPAPLSISPSPFVSLRPSPSAVADHIMMPAGRTLSLKPTLLFTTWMQFIRVLYDLGSCSLVPRSQSVWWGWAVVTLANDRAAARVTHSSVYGILCVLMRSLVQALQSLTDWDCPELDAYSKNFKFWPCIKLIRYGDKSNAYKCYVVLHTRCACYMFQPLLWPSSGRCITNGILRNVWTNGQTEDVKFWK